jgi:hypothetical protein
MLSFFSSRIMGSSEDHEHWGERLEFNHQIAAIGSRVVETF